MFVGTDDPGNIGFVLQKGLEGGEALEVGLVLFEVTYV